MTSGDRRRIEELFVRYELEPTIRDVYVEGGVDVALINQFLKDSKCTDVSVYEISTIAVSRELVEELELENNDRGRAICLGMTMESKLGQDNAQVTCVVDSDFDVFLQKEYECRIVLFTDYTCLEMYLFSAKTIEKFFSVFLRGFPFSSVMVLRALTDTLQEVFMIRLANRVLEWNLEWLSFERCCLADGERIQFDREDYITRYLNKNGVGGADKKQEFIGNVEDLRKKLLPEPRYQIHGHDFINLFCWFIKKNINKAELARPDIVTRSLSLCVSHEDLAKENLFKELLKRVRS